jgi:hypothetical protein
MSTPLRDTAGDGIRTVRGAWQCGSKATWWLDRRDASLNWLALGILLAAWNAADDDSPLLRRRPEALCRHTYVSVRAATLQVGTLHAGKMRAT